MAKSLTKLVACLALAAAPALAGDAAKEIGTAANHAGLAAGAQDPQMVKSHLHHVLNCLEGPGGADFAAVAGNPCQDMGAGAIGDSAPDRRASLEKAVTLAKEGLAELDAIKAKALAAQVQAILGK